MGLGALRAEVSEPDSLSSERVDASVSFDESRLVQDFGLVLFEASAQTRYAFDLGTESWYQRSVKLDEYYKPFAKGYIAPWKLIPTRGQDVITARYEGKKAIDLSRVRFATSPQSPTLPTELHQESKTWLIKLPATDAQRSYDVFAIYEGQVIGKLRVVSYPKQSYRMRLISVNGQSVGDVSSLSQNLNSIYNKYGVEFKLSETENIQAELSAEHIKQDLKKLRERYEKQHPLAQDEVCVFVLSSELSKSSKLEDVEGLMPRKSRFGYIFAGNSPNTEELARTLVHELGHGLFTLQHSFDNEYGGKKSKGKTANLMDYTVGATELAAFQWNVIANTAPFTGTDRGKDGELRNSTEDLIALQKLEAELKKRGAGYIGLRLRCAEYSSKVKKPTVQRVQLPEQGSLKIVGVQSYIVSHSQTHVYGIVSLDSTVVETNTQKQTSSEEQLKRVSKSEAELLLVHFDEGDRLRYCEANTQNYPGICSLNDSAGLTKYIEQFKQDIKLCRSSEQAPTTLGDVRQILLQAKEVFGKHLDFALEDKVYRLNSVDQLEEVSQALRDEDINRGVWIGDAEEYVRLTTDTDGIIQLRAFGISSKLKLAKGKRADLVKVAQHIREKSNSYLQKYRVLSLEDSPSKQGIDLNKEQNVFADGDVFRLDNNAPYIRFVAEGYDAVKTLLKTSELPEKMYRSSEKEKVIIHAPGLVTGSTEAIAETVTDLTSIASLVYDLVVEEEARQAFYNGLLELKQIATDDPRRLVTLLRDLVLMLATGNNLEEWQKVFDRSGDEGERSHLGTRGAVVISKAVIFSGPLLMTLPKMSDDLLLQLKRLDLNTLLGDFNKVKDKGLKTLGELPNHTHFKALDEGTRKRVLHQLNQVDDDLLTALDGNEELIDELLETTAKGAKEELNWYQRMRRGIEFNKERAKFYPYNEVYVVSPNSKSGYVRLDSYNPYLGEIVSRKHTQLAEIHEETAIKYLEELNNKYSPGNKIADVPSNKTGANKNIFEVNGGDELQGQMILEVPVQNDSRISSKVLQVASKLDIIIRDINGKIYK